MVAGPGERHALQQGQRLRVAASGGLRHETQHIVKARPRWVVQRIRQHLGQCGVAFEGAGSALAVIGDAGGKRGGRVQGGGGYGTQKLYGQRGFLLVQFAVLGSQAVMVAFGIAHGVAGVERRACGMRGGGVQKGGCAHPKAPEAGYGDLCI